MRSAQTFLASVAVLATVVLAACGASGTAAPSAAPATPPATARPSAQPTTQPTMKPTAQPSAASGTIVNLGRTGLGNVLVDAKGITLYIWAHDKSTTSTCDGDCAKYWPPLLTTGAPAVGDGLSASLLGTSRRADGAMQVTFNGHPLYYFANDKKAGDTNGEGLTGFGGRWDPVSATGTAVMAGTAVNLGNTALGHVLVDAKGKTLYLWAHDKSSTSTCNGDCAEYWPPLLTTGNPFVTDGLDASLLGTSRRTDGGTQVTYGGHPLYYFVQDTKAGQTNGEGLTGFGGRWDPVSATGAAVQAASMAKADAVDALAVTASSDDQGNDSDEAPLAVRIVAPRPHSTAGSNGIFSVDLTIQARTRAANNLLAGYAPGFIDPHSPQFHPGPDAFAPGLVVLLSTTPAAAGGPNENLAGVFQINDTTLIDGHRGTFNSWLVGLPGFFGRGVTATMTVFVVNGTAPAVITGNEHPISNVIRETFTIAS